MERQERIVNSVGALKSIRNLGITMEEGIAELVDNSVDASSTRIHIHISKKETGNFTISIADDGVGIPEEIPDKPEVSQTIQHVLRFGGRITHHGRAYPVGRFGFGLSQTVTCLTTRSRVFSKVSGGSWRACLYDFEDLMDHKARLPSETNEAPESYDLPPTWSIGDSGTVVILDEIDKPGMKRPETLREHLRNHLGRVYRYHMDKGLGIVITTEKETSTDPIPIRDPIFQIKSSAEVNTFGTQDVEGIVEIVLDGRDAKTLPEIIDPDTGEPAIIKIKMVGVSPKDALELGYSTRKGGFATKWGFNYDGQGFSIVRNGREIKSAETLGIFTKATGKNYFRGEVMFPSCVDNLFRVQVNKSRYRIETTLRDVISNRCSSTINRIATKTLRMNQAIRAFSHPSKVPSAEERSTGLRNVITRRKIPDSEIERKRDALSKRKLEEIEKVVKTEDERVKSVEERLEAARESQPSNVVEVLEEKLKDVKNQSSERKRAIRNRFQVDAFCRKWIKPLATSDLYSIEDYHDEIWVTINSESDFFKHLYERSTQFPEQESLLDLMIFAIAYAEADKANSDDMKEFWRNARMSISRLAATFVSLIDFADDEFDIEVEANPTQIGGV